MDSFSSKSIKTVKPVKTIKPAKKIPEPLKWFLNRNILECGIDEVARGVLFGRVYAAAVIFPAEIEMPKGLVIKDSKALSAKKRELLSEFIKTHAIDYQIAYVEADEIDRINILQASMKAMHKAIKGLNIRPEFLIVDGDHFKEYFYGFGKFISHQCIPQGDNKYISIAAASILAKVAHDKYIAEMIEQYPELEIYDLCNNMGYATLKHRNAIEKYGPSPWHRMTFKRVKEYLDKCDWLENKTFQIETWRESLASKLNESVEPIEYIESKGFNESIDNNECIECNEPDEQEDPEELDLEE
jgi:ribonuclease HII